MDNKPWSQYYDPGVNHSPIYKNVSLKDQFISWVKKQPDRPYIYFEDEVIKYQQTNALACKLANGLINAGINKGDRVAIALSNIPEFIIAVHACLKIGAVFVPTNPFYTERELTYQYINSGAETVICLERDLDINLKIMRYNPESLKRIIVIASNDDSTSLPKTENIISYDKLMTNGQAVEPDIDVSTDDLVLLLYTGGTTGVSKGCPITNANLIAVSTVWMQSCQGFTDINNYKVLSSTPLYHIYAFQTAINMTILLGGSMIIMPTINDVNVIKAINRHEPNVWPAVPTLIEGLIRHPDLSSSKANKLQFIPCGASPLTALTMENFERIVGVRILEGYGASETTMSLTSSPYLKRKIGSVGIPYPNVDLKVVDIETGTKELPPGIAGELCFKGPQVIKKYWENPTETALAFKKGWWYSGDIGYMDEDGYVYLVDRKKDMIICSGFKVFSNEVDAILKTHPKILDAAVIGVPDPKRGETVKAYVVIVPGKELTQDEIRSYCREYLVAYKVPTIVEFINELPRTSTRKIDRKALRLFDQDARE